MARKLAAGGAGPGAVGDDDELLGGVDVNRLAVNSDGSVAAVASPPPASTLPLVRVRGLLRLRLPCPRQDIDPYPPCESCNACLEICPTSAFTGPYEFDARRCIPYLTIEHKSSRPTELRPLMGNRIFGCDDCQLVCPWNRFEHRTNEADFHPRHDLDDAELIDLFNLSREEFLNKPEG